MLKYKLLREFYKVYRKFSQKKLQEELTADYILPLGEACRPAHYLTLMHLRKHANPLDWIMEYSLEDVANLIESDFENFFSCSEEMPSEGYDSRRIMDITNGMLSLHGFPKACSVDEHMPQFQSIMKKRWQRMKYHLENSHHTIFIGNRSENENFESFLRFIQKKFPAKYTFVNISSSTNGKAVKKISFEKNLTLIQFSFNDTSKNKKNAWHGNFFGWIKVTSLLHLTDTFFSQHNKKDIYIETDHQR